MSSITEVAKLAGVSIATASRVVSEADYPVSAATRERVLEAARTLDYVPNALARGMLKRQVPVVGVIVHDITDPYFAELVRGVEDAASLSGFLVITCSTERDGDREREYLRLLRSMRAAGVIFAGSGRDDDAAQRGPPAAHRQHPRGRRRGRPPLAARRRASRRSASTTRAASRRWSRRWSGWATERIAFLAGPSALFVARDRLAGYRRGLAEAGLAVDERLVVRTSFDREGGALGVDTLLAGERRRSPRSAAPTTCSRSARWGGSHELGIRVPDEVSVAGFDDIAVAALTAPGPVDGPDAPARARPARVRRGRPRARRRGRRPRGACRSRSCSARRPAAHRHDALPPSASPHGGTP